MVVFDYFRVFCLFLWAVFPLLAHAGASWESKLQGIDLDPEVAGFEAYYDKKTDVTWLTDLGAIRGTPYEWHGNNGEPSSMAWWDQAMAWTAQLKAGKVSGWRLPTEAEFGSMFFKTLGNTSNLLTQPGPFKNFGSCHPDAGSGAWIGCYVWTSDVLGYSGADPIIRTFGIDGYGWNTSLPQNPMIAWAVHPGKLLGGTKWCVQKNKLYQGEVSASEPIYAGDLRAVVDCRQSGGSPNFFNLPAYTGWFRVTVPEAQCFSYFKLMATMDPNGTMDLMIHLEDGEQNELYAQEYVQTVTGGEQYKLSLAKTVCGVRSVRFETLSSPSWVGWMEARGF